MRKPDFTEREANMSSKLSDVNRVVAPDLPDVVAPGEPSLTSHTPSLLLVEDDEAVSRIVAKLLRFGGYRVITAQRGSESLQLLDDDGDIDIVLVDLLLPEMTGMQVAALINAKHPDIPVIFATGAGNVAELKGIEEERLLRKPFSERELFDKIAAAMKHEHR